MRGNQGSYWYVLVTLVLIVGLVTWFLLQPGGQASSPSVAAADVAPATPEPSPPPQSTGPSTPEVVGLVALLIVPIAGIVVIARLQQRRKAAYRDAARQQKEAARAADMSAARRDQNLPS